MKFAKVAVVFVFIFSSVYVYGQRFSFLPEVGVVFSQVDGDKLNGFHKRGYLIGVGTNYPIHDNVRAVIKSSFYHHGSARSGPFQPKLEEGSQIVIDINSVAVEGGILYKPHNKRILFGMSLAYHRMIDYEYKLIDNVIGGPPRLLDPTTVSNQFATFKITGGLSLGLHGRISLHFERSFNDLLNSEFLNLSRLLPYNMALTYSYEFNPHIVKKKRRRKSRR